MDDKRSSAARDDVVQPLAPHTRIRLPSPVARIYEAVKELESMYPRRSFTPDGHMVGSIGEVVAATALNLKLLNSSYPGHDAHDGNGYVQIKMTAGRRISMYASSERLVVLRIVSPEEAEIVYDGPGQPAWDAAGKIGKNGQRVVSISTLHKIAAKMVGPKRKSWELQAREGRFEKVPASLNWNNSAMFAHLLNAYEIIGIDAVGSLANSKAMAAEAGDGWIGTATELWMCLFFEHRRWRHAGIEPSDMEVRLLNSLCQTLRQRLLTMDADERVALLALLAANPFPGTLDALVLDEKH